MITVVVIKNPLDPWGSQEILYLPNGVSIDDCVDAVYPPIPTTYDLAVSYDGTLIDVYNPPPVPDDCSVVFIAIPQGGGGGGGGGKNAFKAIAGGLMALIGLLTYAYGGAALASFGVSLMVGGGSMMLSGVAGLLLAPSSQNLIGATDTPNLIEGTTLDKDQTAASSNTYGWATQSNKIGEGITLPELYGEMRVVPPLIGKYVQTIGDKQYLYMLLAVCRWNIDTKDFNAQFITEGIQQVNSPLRGVYINDMESVYFGDIVVEVAPGYNIQNVLKGFSEVHTDIPHSREMLTTDYYEFDTAGSFINAISLSFVFPYGLFKTDTTQTGTTSVETSVDLYFQHAPYVSDDHVYLESEYIECIGVTIGQSIDFRLNCWSAGYFNGESNPDGTSIWIQVTSEPTSASHQYGDIYTTENVLPVDLILPTCNWYRVVDGVLECSEVTAPITKYKPIYSLDGSRSATVTKNITSSFSVDFLIANTPRESLGRRHIRCKRGASSITDFNGRDKVLIQLSQEIVYKELTYPNVSLVGVQALATDKLSGSLPTVSVVVSRSVLFVWGPNPDHPNDDDRWQYNAVRADNPAWICYDLLHGCRYVQNALTQLWEYVQTGPIIADNMRYENFKDWADFCDIHTKFNCYTRDIVLSNTTDWIALKQAVKYPVVDDTFTISIVSDEYKVTAVKSEQSVTLLPLTTEYYTVKGVTSITGFTPSIHVPISSGSVFTVTPATHDPNPENIIGSELSENSLINTTLIYVQHDGVTTIPAGTVFTVEGHTDQYVVTERAYMGRVPFLPAAKEAWSQGDNVYFGATITPGVVTTYTISEVCAGGTIYFTPACDTIWPVGSVINIQNQDTFMTTFIKVSTSGGFEWPENMLMYCVDHATSADYPYKKRYTCNIYFDVTTNLKSALTTVGLCGRGSVIQEGSKYSCVVERAEQLPVQRFIFNMANIQDSSFTETWMSLDERSNCFEIKYWDRYNDYKEDVVTIQTDTINDLTEMKRTAVDLIGCTDEDMAIAFGKYLLNVNRYVTLTASWTSHIDSIGCFPGQIIEVQHDVPQFGYGGRLLAGCTTTKLIFDKNLTFIPGSPTLDRSYEIIFYHQANDTREAITYHYTGATETVTNVIDGLTGILVAPVADSKFIFGEVGRSSKLMRVVSITRDSEFKNKITAIEFENNVYSDGVTIVPENISNLPQELRPPMLDEVTTSIVWYLNTKTKIYDPYIQIEGECGSLNRRNLTPITAYRLYGHIEEGDTRNITDKNTVDYQLVPASLMNTIQFNTQSSFSQKFEHVATELIGRTVFAAMTQVNVLGYESPKRIADPFYVVTAYDDLTTMNLEIDATALGSIQGFYYDASVYTICLKWTPIGWELNNSKYRPIEIWNNGSNWYMYTQYAVVYGFVEDPNDTPALADLQYVLSNNIGDIFDSAGEKITDATVLHNNAIIASQTKIVVPYDLRYLKIAVVAIKKLGGFSHLDPISENLGLDWVPVRMMVPYKQLNVLNTEIQDLELIVSMQNKSVFLNEIRWDYPLISPEIDGFAIIYRIQNFWWAWATKKIIPRYESGTTPLDFAGIISDVNTYIDWTTGGGLAGRADFTNQIIKWMDSNAQSIASGMPIKHKYIYMTLTYQDQYEIFKVSIESGSLGTTTRNVEKLPTVYYETVSVSNETGDSQVIINPTMHVHKFDNQTGSVFILNNDYTNIYTVTSHPSQTVLNFTPNVVVPFAAGDTLKVGDINNTDGIQAWPIGTTLSYLPNEWNDSLAFETNTSIRSYTFETPLEINCALHMTLIAAKLVKETQEDSTPGYERTPYSVWEAKVQ